MWRGNVGVDVTVYDVCIVYVCVACVGGLSFSSHNPNSHAGSG